MKELIDNVYSWAEDRGFFKEDGASITTQALKLGEELGELIFEYNFISTNLKGNLGNEIEDEIGDNLVVLLIISRLANSTAVEDILLYNTITKSCANDISCLMLHLGTLQGNIAKGKPIDRWLRMYTADLQALFEREDFTLKDALERAYNKIKDRKGQWINGSFVKEGDL